MTSGTELARHYGRRDEHLRSRPAFDDNKPLPGRALPVTDRWSVGAPINHAVSDFEGDGHTATRGDEIGADRPADFGSPGPRRVSTRGDQAICGIYRSQRTSAFLVRRPWPRDILGRVARLIAGYGPDGRGADHTFVTEFADQYQLASASSTTRALMSEVCSAQS